MRPTTAGTASQPSTQTRAPTVATTTRVPRGHPLSWKCPIRRGNSGVSSSDAGPQELGDWTRPADGGVCLRRLASAGYPEIPARTSREGDTMAAVRIAVILLFGVAATRADDSKPAKPAKPSPQE